MENIWMAIVASLIFLRVGAAFCPARTFPPAPGGHFTLPRKQCLSQEFLDSAFNRLDFGKERIALASNFMNPKNISFQGISMPLKLAASSGWESGHTVTAIIDILLREVFGVNTEFACTWGSVHTMAMLAGCNLSDTGKVEIPLRCDEAPRKLLSPLAHVSLESWVTTASERDAMNAHTSNLGMLGYASKSGLYFDKAIATKAFKEDHVSLEWWESFVVPDVNKYFDTYNAVAADIDTFFNGSAAPFCRQGTVGFAKLLERGFVCTDGWYFSSACAENKASCVPVILAEFSWNMMPWVEAAEKNGYRFAITWLGASNWLTFSMHASTKFMFYCASTNALCSAKPLAKMFGDTKAPVGRPDFITSLLKVVWRELLFVDREIQEFISQINFPSADLEALMAGYKYNADQSEQVPDLACDWLTNKINVFLPQGDFTGNNTLKWSQWLPRVCAEGERYNKASGVCGPCAPGEYSADGKACWPCTPGTFAATAGLPGCSLCPAGTWQDAGSGTACDTCSQGFKRSSSDRGCIECTPGHFAESTGSADCSRCEKGTWTGNSGSSNCVKCAGDLSTTTTAAVNSTDCVCLKQTYWPCRSTTHVEDVGGIVDFYASMPECRLWLHQGQEPICRECPRGASCDGPGFHADWHQQPKIHVSHYVLAHAPHEVYRCAQAKHLCLGEFTLGEMQCGGLRRGLQCHSCPAGYRATQGQPCEPCPQSGVTWMFPLACLAGCGAMAVAYKLAAGRRETNVIKAACVGTLAIILVNVQMFSIVASVTLASTSDAESPVSVALDTLDSMFSLDFDLLTASSCHFGDDVLAAKYLPGLLMPVAVVVIMAGEVLLSRLFNKLKPRWFTPWSGDQAINACGLVVMSLYVSVCKAVFNILECRENPSAAQTLRNHDGFHCLGDDVQSVFPALVCGVLLYIVAFSAMYIWVIVRAPSAYANDSGFRLRTDFLLRRWHPELWYWGIFFLFRNLLCSLVPSVTTDASQQALLLFGLLLPMFVAQVRCWPWRDETTNKNDTITMCALLLTLVIALAIQAKATDLVLVGVLSALSLAMFIAALIACFFILISLVRLEWSSPANVGGTGEISQGLPTLMLSQRTSDKVIQPVLDTFEGSANETKGGKRNFDSSLGSGARIGEIFQIIRDLSQWKEEDGVLGEIVQQLGSELPTNDLRKLHWGLAIVGYHVLGDQSRRPRGVALTPVTRRSNSRQSSNATYSSDSAKFSVPSSEDTVAV